MMNRRLSSCQLRKMYCLSTSEVVKKLMLTLPFSLQMFELAFFLMENTMSLQISFKKAKVYSYWQSKKLALVNSD